jgi:DNA-binding Xre family transcriptional regulator
MPETYRVCRNPSTTSAGGGWHDGETATATCHMGLRHRLAEYTTEERTAYRIAKDAGISTNTIYRWLADPTSPISWQALEKLCRVLEVQPGNLLSYVND